MRRHLIVAGGGTGGHVLAGVAVADAWMQKFGASASVCFVGARGGIEESLVPRAGYPLELLRLGALNRVSALKKLKTFFLLPFSLIRSLQILASQRPEAVLGVGGYASGPLVLMASAGRKLGLFRPTTAVLEQNSVSGLTNRILSRRVDKVFSAFPAPAGTDPRKVIFTGNPIRSMISRFPPAPRDPFTIFIFGGSQGAAGINSLVLEALPHLGGRLPKLRFVHQTGERDYERVVEGYRKAEVIARVEKFIHDMPTAYQAASLLICRAGSSTLSEIAAVGRASILIPFPQASDNHQELNARVFSDVGAAELLLQGGARGLDLAAKMTELMDHPERIRAMEDAVSRFYRPGAAQRIVDELAQ